MTGVGAFLVVVSIGVAVWLQLAMSSNPAGAPTSFEETERLIYVLYSLIPVGVGVAVMALGRVLDVLTSERAKHPV